MPARSESSGSRGAKGWPANVISPESACSAPARMFMSVDLPAPFSPSRAWTSPARASKSTWSLARTPGKDLTTPTASRAAGMAGVVMAGPDRQPFAWPLGPGRRVAPDRPGPRISRQRRQLAVDALVPPVHADFALRPGGTGRELVEVGLLEL